MTHPALQVLQEIAEEAPGPRLPLAQKLYHHAPDGLLDEVPARYATRRLAPPRRERDELRPLISDPMRLRAFHVAGRLPLLDFASSAETRQDLVALKHHLLYAHAVGFSDPIDLIYDARWDELELSAQELIDALQTRRARVANLALFLTEAEPLLDSGAVVFVARGTDDVPALDSATTRRLADDEEVKAAYAALSEAGKAMLARGVEREFGLPPGHLVLGPELFVVLAEAGIQACLAHGAAEGAFDLYFPHRGFQAVFRAIVNAGGAAAEQHPVVSLRCLTDLVSIELPRVADLAPADVVRLREEGEAFMVWRARLRRALAELYAEVDRNPDFTTGNVEAPRVLYEALQEGAAAVRGEVARSSVLGRLKAGAMQFSVSVVVGGATVPVAASESARAALKLAGSYLGGLKGRRTQKALARHFAVFEP